MPPLRIPRGGVVQVVAVVAVVEAVLGEELGHTETYAVTTTRNS